MVAKQKEQTFLFVNKDGNSDSLSTSKASEKRRILSHVQINRRTLDKGKVEQLAWEGNTISLTSNDAICDSTRQDDQKNALVLRQTASGLRNLSHIYPLGNGSDPFFCTSGGRDPRLHFLLQQGLGQLAKMPFLATAFAPASVIQKRTSMRHDGIIIQRLQRCVNDKVLMYCSLAYCASSLFGLINSPNIRPEIFLDRAIPVLRNKLATLQGQPDSWLLLSIYSLAIVELWYGAPNMAPLLRPRPGMSDPARLKACRTHLKAVYELMKSTLDTSACDSYVLESIILGDKYLALVDHTKPILNTTWDPGSVPPKGPDEYMAVDRDSSAMAGAFFSSPIRSHDLMVIIQDIVTYIQTATYAWERPVMTAQKESWLFLRYHALIYRLLNLDGLTGIDELARLTILLFFVSVASYAGSDVASAILAGHLRTALEGDNMWRHWSATGSAKMVFWIMCMGSMISANCSNRAWFRGKVICSAVKAGVAMTRASFHHVLEEYLFLPERQEHAFHNFMTDMLVL